MEYLQSYRAIKRTILNAQAMYDLHTWFTKCIFAQQTPHFISFFMTGFLHLPSRNDCSNFLGVSGESVSSSSSREGIEATVPFLGFFLTRSRSSFTKLLAISIGGKMVLWAQFVAGFVDRVENFCESDRSYLVAGRLRSVLKRLTA